MYSLIEVSSGTKLGPVDLRSDVPPIRGIQCLRTFLHLVSLTFAQPLDQADLWSDVFPQ